MSPYRSATADVDMGRSAVAGNVTAGNTGGGQAFNIRDPFIEINCIIALQGISPPRN